jgi:hypothetical protein
LATNIVESGLDIPRANTIVVFHPAKANRARLHIISWQHLAALAHSLSLTGLLLTPRKFSPTSMSYFRI